MSFSPLTPPLLCAVNEVTFMLELNLYAGEKEEKPDITYTSRRREGKEKTFVGTAACVSYLPSIASLFPYQCVSISSISLCLLSFPVFISFAFSGSLSTLFLLPLPPLPVYLPSLSTFTMLWWASPVAVLKDTSNLPKSQRAVPSKSLSWDLERLRRRERWGERPGGEGEGREQNRRERWRERERENNR